MSNRVLRTGFVVLPVLSLAFGVVVACSDEELDPASPRADASADVMALPDGSQGGVDANRPDTGNDSGGNENDAGGDEDDAGDAGVDQYVPPLCETYSNETEVGDAAVGELPKRYDVLAQRVIKAAGGFGGHTPFSCEIAPHFDENDTLFLEPYQEPCLALQLQALAGCFIGGVAVDYSNIAAEGVRCADGTAGVHLGFWEPTQRAYTKKDVEKLIEIIRAEAIGVGYSPAKADQLKALLDAKISTVVLNDAGFEDAGYSDDSRCP